MTARDLRLVALPPSAYAGYRSEAIWAARKWDPQIGDVSVLSDHAVVLSARAARELSSLAESLAAETLELDRALLARPRLWPLLGLGRRLERALRAVGPRRPDDLRLMRFDFHPTPRGWAVSEVNSDVPGGLGEAAVLPRLATALIGGVQAPATDPATEVARAFARRLPDRGTIALVHATAYSDDRQVMDYVSSVLVAHGFRTVLASPDHIRAETRGGLIATVAGSREPVHGLYRFFPAEWLPNLSGGWERFFRAALPACNHPVSLLSQAKRAPLAWARLGVPCPAWSEHLPQTVDPRKAAWRRDPAWVLKPSLGRVGEDVALRDLLASTEWKRIRRDARRHPRDWIAQRRFSSRAVQGERGDRHVCLGVYTVEGRTAGYYARLSAAARIDQYAEDAPVLMERSC